jgi:hypothetical protein
VRRCEIRQVPAHVTDHVEDKERLTFAQEKTWNEFVAATGANVPCDLVSIRTVFAEALRISHQIDLPISNDIRAFRGLLKDRLLDWAAERKAAGLDLDATLVIICRYEDVSIARNAIHTTFYEDKDVNGAFRGANITGSVRSAPPQESVAGFTFIVGDGDAEERLNLGWSIQQRESHEEARSAPPWWQFWRK